MRGHSVSVFSCLSCSFCYVKRMIRVGGFLLLPALAVAQFTAATLPTNDLLSEPGPTFQIDGRQLGDPVTFIAYGDQRFTDPANVRASNPRARQWLVNQIAAEKPGALILNGDV